jgi:penicillin-binding protein 1A
MYAFEHRKLIEISEVPPYLIEMLIQVEDSNFYSHWGVDVVSIIRAAYQNFRSGRTTQGASTITQQLARNMFLSTERRYSRKIKEAMLAVIIEKQFTKQEILEAYLNKVLFGNGYYGIESASMNYFLKTSSELTIEESALLVGLLRGSGFYNPLRHPERATNRRNFVLNLAHEKKIISTDQYNVAKATPVNVNRVSVSSNPQSDYFIEYIRPYLERTYTTNQLFTGGMKIYTTLDWDMQVYADSVMKHVLSTFDTSRRYRAKYADVPAGAVNIKTDYLQGGVFAMDPHNGEVLVMIGGRNFQHSKFNRIMQARRQPGSAFKPFLYAAAIEQGFTASTVITDEPVNFLRGGRPFWQPKNYTNDFRGPVRLREALQRSINTVAAKIIYDIGPQRFVTFLNKLEFSTRMGAYYSLSVGACEVIPFELIKAYTIFPGRGEMVEPVFIKRVTDSTGKVLEEATVRKKRVMSQQDAFIVTDMMKSVINEGTAASARTQGFRMPAGGKTGTTDDYKDAWFIGFTKNLVMGTWVGFDDNRPMGRAMTGGVAALPIWTPVMRYYERQLTAAGRSTTEDFDRPSGISRIEVSRRTGLAGSYGDPTYTEVFNDNFPPRRESEMLEYNFFMNTHFITPEDHIVDTPW